MGRNFIAFALVRPEDFALSDDELLERVTEIVKERNPHHFCTVKLDSGFISPDRPSTTLS